MKSANYPKFSPANQLVPLECRVAGLSTKELLYHLKEVFSFLRYGHFGRSEWLLRNQLLVLLEGREVDEEVIEAACIMGIWEGDRTWDNVYARHSDDSATD